jgi:hypothetical protein
MEMFHVKRNKPHIKIMTVFGGQRVWRCCDPKDPHYVYAGLTPESAYSEWQKQWYKSDGNVWQLGASPGNFQL